MCIDIESQKKQTLDKVKFCAIIIAIWEKGGKMTNNTQRQIDQINTKYVKVAKRNGLNPVWLKEIVDLHNRGFNYSQIAQRIGVSRETVSTYFQRLRSANRNDYWLLIVGAVLIGGGIYVLSKYLEGSTPPTPPGGSSAI